ncbi:protein FAR1-RELATED SEQUENCE 5-like [Ananas comosus]|uniref:Protein FAR1-RELATED SEQUENCE n=1 Tax=Ananas comosus TaxID=4615 RepID=A0A6P5EGF2_ANACO|nr:protein FAR1-RELATED SEQUENCE 5-like [Ananas comosus]
MFGQHPKAIIIDQDPAMKKAIEQVFPQTVHRCCEWHVMRKAREHLGLVYSTKEGFQKELFSCIDGSITIEEFEMRWIGMLQKFDLYDNKHLQFMWSNRHQWVPAYFRDTFFAVMCTSQCSESINVVTKIWVDNHTSIYKFVLQIEKVIETQYDKEDEEDYRMRGGEVKLYSYNPIEVQARDIYTKRNFFEFKEQLRLISGHSLLELEKNSLYKTTAIHNPTMTYTISVNRLAEKVSCNCKMFEFTGLLCSHILKVLHYIGIYSIPSHYILKRWAENAQRRSFNIQSIQHEAMGDSLHAKAIRSNVKQEI